MIKRIDKAMKQMEHSLTTTQGSLIYTEYRRNPRHQELPQNIAAFYQSDLLNEMKTYVNNDELTTTEVYGIFNLALKKLSDHSMVYIWENKDGVPMVGTTSAIYPFRYYLPRVSCMLFCSISQYMVLSVILTAVVTLVVNAGKGYIKHRRAYNDKIDCFAFSILTWLRYPQQFNEERTCIIYPPFRYLDCIPANILKAALMRFGGRCSAKDWDQVVKHIHRNTYILRTTYESQGHLIECWELAPMGYTPQKNSILQTIANRLF